PLCPSYPLCPWCAFFSYQMYQQAVPKFGFEPRGLRRHDRAGIGYRDQVGHADGIQRERDRRLAAIHEVLQLARAARAADEVDALVGADVGDLQDRREQLVLEDADVECADRIGRVGWNSRAQRLPAAG